MRDTAAGTGRGPRSAFLLAAGILAALVLGSLYPVSAFRWNPLALPAALTAVVLAAWSLRRPELGVAVALVLVALNAGLAGSHPWIPGAVWVGFMVVAAVLHLPSRARVGPRLPSLGPVVILFFAGSVVAVSQAADLGATAPVVRATATGAALFFLIASLLRTRRQLEWAVAGAVAGAAVIGAYATWQYLGGVPSDVGFVTSSGRLVSRVSGGFSQPNQLAGFLALVLPLAVAGAMVRRRGRGLYLAASAVAAVGIYASFSRGALVAVALVPLIALRGTRAWLVVPLLGLALLVATPGLLRERFAAGIGEGTEIEGRADFWRAALTIWSEHPVLGVGPGGFAAAYAEARVPGGKNFLQATIFEPPPHAHNLFLNLLAEEGVVGLAAFAAVLGLSTRQALRLRRSQDPWVSAMASGLLASIAVLVVHNLFDVTLLEGTSIYFWALLGVLSALSAIDARQRAALPAGASAGHTPPAVLLPA